MKKTLLSLVVATGMFVGCQNSETAVQEQEAKIDMSDFYTYTDIDETDGKSINSAQCHSMHVLNRQLHFVHKLLL